MFYEFRHSHSANYFCVETGMNLTFPSHLHSCFELIVLLEGTMQVDADMERYTLSAGDALLLFPNQIHSLTTPEHSRHVLCLFSTDLVSAYSEKTAAKVPLDNRFRPDPFYVAQLGELQGSHSLLRIKGLLYSLCGAFDENARYRETNSASHMLLYRIFKFIETNYDQDCTLSALAHGTGYDYAYLSRYFRKIVGIPYNDYVNQYRVSRACYLLQNTEKTVLEISSECGFNSLRSLNRNFKEQLGVPPAEYRRSYRKSREDMR